MKGKILTLLVGLLLIASSTGVYALDASTPYTVVMNFIVGVDTSFTVTLAASETSIDFNPATLNSKEVEPDEQVAGSTTPMATITNTGNSNLNFTHIMNETNPAWVEISYDVDETVDWTKLLSDGLTVINASVPSADTVEVYFWANFTSADAGTTARTYQINSSAA